MIDPVWAGVVGALGGAAVGALTSLAAPLINWRVERKRLDHESQQAEVESRRQTVREWREGLAAATDAFAVWALEQQSNETADSREPGFEGQLWYESLRPHLSEEIRRSAYYADFGTVRDLADEIARIEREWNLSPSPK